MDYTNFFWFPQMICYPPSYYDISQWERASFGYNRPYYYPEVYGSNGGQQIPSEKRTNERKCEICYRNQLLRARESFLDEQFQRKKQKQDRNSYSNSLKVFIKYLRDLEKKQPQLIFQVISTQKWTFNYTMNDFYQELNQIFPMKKAYIGMAEVKRISRGFNCSSSFVVIFRILFRLFYKKQVYGCVLTSKKIIGKAKNKQVEEARIVYRKLLEP